jgi:hypothetical protein
VQTGAKAELELVKAAANKQAGPVIRHAVAIAGVVRKQEMKLKTIRQKKPLLLTPMNWLSG